MTRRHRLNVAIVGAGLMGRWHASCAATAGAVVAAVVDPDQHAAGRLAKTCAGAVVYSALEPCLAHSRIDVVHLCVPTGLHYALASIALSHDAHVLVEKPTTGSAAEAEELVALARARGVLINPVHQLPFQRGFRQLRRQEGTLGTPTRVAFVCSTAGGDGLAEADRAGLLLDILPHPLSLFYALFGARVFDTLALVAAIDGHELEIGGTLDDTRLSAVVSLRARPTELGVHYLGIQGSGHVDLFHGFYVGEAGRVSRRAKLTRPMRRGASLLGASGLNLLRRAARSQWAYPGLSELIHEFYDSIAAGQPAPIDSAELIGVSRVLDRLRGRTTEAAR